ncbi:hypothetical protein G7054_g952 [Neopestalotiopsis clavispora]|nr:hypothetical protein G7054_g952 [Neopestalotiopsis clavispora]
MRLLLGPVTPKFMLWISLCSIPGLASHLRAGEGTLNTYRERPTADHDGLYKVAGKDRYGTKAYHGQNDYHTVLNTMSLEIPSSTAAPSETTVSDTLISVETSVSIGPVISTVPSTLLNSISTSVSSTFDALPSTPRNLCSGHDHIIGDVHCLGNFLIGCGTIFNAVNVDSLEGSFVPNIPDKEACHQSCIDDPVCMGWISLYESVAELWESGIMISQYCRHIFNTVQFNTTEPFGFGEAFGLRGFCDFPIAGPASTSEQGGSTASAVAPQITPTSATDLCPDMDGQCLNGFKVRCERLIFNDVTPLLEGNLVANISEEVVCHETCVEDSGCTAWWGERDSYFKTYTCYHGTMSVSIKPMIAESQGEEFMYSSYGVRKTCQ